MFAAVVVYSCGCDWGQGRHVCGGRGRERSGCGSGRCNGSRLGRSQGRYLCSRGRGGGCGRGKDC